MSYTEKIGLPFSHLHNTGESQNMLAGFCEILINSMMIGSAACSGFDKSMRMVFKIGMKSHPFRVLAVIHVIDAHNLKSIYPILIQGHGGRISQIAINTRLSYTLEGMPVHCKAYFDHKISVV